MLLTIKIIIITCEAPHVILTPSSLHLSPLFLSLLLSPIRRDAWLAAAVGRQASGEMGLPGTLAGRWRDAFPVVGIGRVQDVGAAERAVDVGAEHAGASTGPREGGRWRNRSPPRRAGRSGCAKRGACMISSSLAPTLSTTSASGIVWRKTNFGWVEPASYWWCEQLSMLMEEAKQLEAGKQSMRNVYTRRLMYHDFMKNYPYLNHGIQWGLCPVTTKCCRPAVSTDDGFVSVVGPWHGNVFVIYLLLPPYFNVWRRWLFNQRLATRLI
jgi:hypothetical protein